MSKAGRFEWPWQRKKKSARAPKPVAEAPAPLKPRAALAAEAPAQQRRPDTLPRFQTTAADHPDRGRRDPRARERIRLRQSFTPAQPVSDPRMFAGRRDVLTSAIRAVEDQRSHVVIYGSRGVGKTSLLRMLTSVAEEAKYIVVYFSCGASSDFTETFRTSAAEIPLLYHSSISPTTSNSEIGSSLADLLGPGKLTPRMFGDAAAKLVGTRVLLVLDEFDRAESPEFRRDVAELIKTLSDVSARVQLIIAGVAADLADLIEHIPSIRRNISAIRVGAMPDEEVRQLIENGAQMSGVNFSPKGAELITSASRGSPYIANLLCHFAGMHALDAERLQVEEQDVAFALEQAMEEFRGRIPAALLKHLDDGDLLHLTADREDLTGRDASSREKRETPAKMLERLQKEGAIDGSRPSVYALFVDSLTPYLQLKQVRETFRTKAA